MRVDVDKALIIIMVATFVLQNIALGGGEGLPPDDINLQQMLENQRRNRPMYHIYENEPDDVIAVPDRPIGLRPRSGQAT